MKFSADLVCLKLQSKKSCRLEKDQLLLYGKRIVGALFGSSFQSENKPYRIWKLIKDASKFDWTELVQDVRPPQIDNSVLLCFPKILAKVH